MNEVCKHCKKKRGNHQARTLACPVGGRSRIGYTAFHSTQVFEARKSRKKKDDDFRV